MPRFLRSILPYAAGVWLLTAAPGAQAFYCGEQLIEIGAPEEAVLRKCGAPDHSEAWEEEWLQKAGDAFERSVSVPFAEWIYDSGANRLLRVLLFRDGVLKHIESRTYAPGSGAECSARIIEVGETKYEVLRKCGQPTARKQVTEKHLDPLDPVNRRRYPVTTERWTYRSQGEALPRVIVFRNRRVIEVEVGATSP